MAIHLRDFNNLSISLEKFHSSKHCCYYLVLIDVIVTFLWLVTQDTIHINERFVAMVFDFLMSIKPIISDLLDLSSWRILKVIMMVRQSPALTIVPITAVEQEECCP